MTSDAGADRAAKAIPIVEIFGPTIQGEGFTAGLPAVFIRSGGCGYRCSWCDSMHAVDPRHAKTWHRMTPEDVAQRVMDLAPWPLLVVFSGGDPCMHEGFAEVAERLNARGYTTQIETQGALNPPWLLLVDHVCVSPKPPSSGMVTDVDRLNDVIRFHKPRLSLKVPIADAADLQFAVGLHLRAPDVPFFVQPVNPLPGIAQSIDDRITRLRALVDMIKADPKCGRMRVGPQLHTLLWGEARGV